MVKKQEDVQDSYLTSFRKADLVFTIERHWENNKTRVPHLKIIKNRGGYLNQHISIFELLEDIQNLLSDSDRIIVDKILKFRALL